MRRAVPFPSLCGIAACLLALCGFAGCTRDESPVPSNGDPETFRHLDIRYLRGFLRYRINASLPLPERFSAEILLRVTNTDPAKAFTGLTIPYADLYANVDMSALGAMPLTTTWDGNVKPLETDTILLRNDSLRQGLIEVRCGQPVFFALRLVADPRNSKLVATDSLRFECIP